MQTIIQGDCLEEMRKMEDNSIDCILTDPPYGLSFMGKKWDKEVPGIEYWKETYRICKPGAFLLAAGAPRSHHHLALAIEQAGWEITDCIMHVFGSGFPKGKSQLKPAYEPWILSRKKADKVVPLNIDDCRVGPNPCYKYPNGRGGRPFADGFDQSIPVESTKGRWPANIIFDEEAAAQLDEMSGESKSSDTIRNNQPRQGNSFGKGYKRQGLGHKDSGGASRFFYCAKASSKERNAGLQGMELKEFPDIGKHKRITCGAGKDNFIPRQNTHPTVKPIRLMEYLLKLIMPKDSKAIVLDPFLGSGSTLVAAKHLGFKAIGIEREKEYCEIAIKRVEHATFKDEQLEFAI